ncbi:MAG: CHAT domain-containing protein [Scytonema sp. PMC 1069.18]|nr:CHAT domain-containing protein [Scytonema sp. PMC 1069.18]MEC4884190.1 CHAT domain-containing protein [Scytonema sp. PMC 1070.18]
MTKKQFVFISHLQTLFVERQKFGYGILACLTALLCIFTAPVIARDTTTQGFTPPQIAILSQEQEAKNLYTVGRFTEAVTVLQQALQIYHGNGDTIGQAVVLSNLALNFQQLGQMPQAIQAIENAIALLQKTPDSPQRLTVWAQAVDVKGSLQLAQGKAEAALLSWQQAASFYQKLQDSNKVTLVAIKQAQALQTLGLYQRAISTLDNLKTTLQNQPDSLIKAANLRSLGDALLIAGNLKQAQENLQASLKIAQQLRSPENIAAAYLSLGNLARAQSKAESAQSKEKAENHNKQALGFYQQSEVIGNTSVLKTQAQLNRLRLLVEMKQWSEAQALYPQIQSQIAHLSVGRPAIYAQVQFAQNLLELRQKSATPSPETIGQILAVAYQQAEQLQDVRAESFVLGNLGHLYEKTQQWAIAQDLTQKALNLSKSIQAQDIAYRWQWQLGRILCLGQTQCNNQEKFTDAIAAYTEAFNSLQSIQGDLIASNADVQFSFRESVEPVYRGLVDLLLQSPESSQNNLQQARNVLEALQVANLQNFLQQACQDTKLQLDQVIDTKDPHAAVIYSIILDDRLEVIVKLPNNQDLYHSLAIKLPKQEIEATLKQFYDNLTEEGAYQEVKQDGQKVYNWLIQPIQTKLEQSNIKTLIFVLDGLLRKIPMASLYDSKQYLMEKYAISLALGLHVGNPIPLRRREMKALVASLTQPQNDDSESFSRLENVQKEVAEIKNTGIDVSSIAEEQFTTQAFNKKLNTSNFEIVHLATHGYFGGNRENTFVLTADGRMKLDDFKRLFQRQGQKRTKAIEILFLSACQTATGNDQAVMGIAGTAVRAGASSAIASLWDLDDESSVLFAKAFYQHLGKPNINRAEALRQAQLALLKNANFDHPRFWAPYVLVGSWL